jgi:DHA2 family multidrug resistance protein
VVLDKGQEDDWFGSRFIVTLAILAAVMLPAFVIRQLRLREPMVHFRLLRHTNFAAGVVLVTVMGFVLYGSLVLLPLFMQTLLGWTAQTTGIWTSPRGIGTALCMPLVGYLLTKNWDGRWMLVFGFSAAGIAFYTFSHMSLSSGTWDIFTTQIIQGTGMAFVFVPLTTLTMDPIPKVETGYATSLYSVMRNIGSSMGISFVTTWIARRSQFHQAILAAHTTPYNLRMGHFLGSAQSLVFHHGADPATSGRRSVGLLYGMVQQQAALLSFVEAFRVMAILFVIIIPLVLLMKRARTGRDSSVVAAEH